MRKENRYRAIDLIAIAVANLFNLIMIPVFFLRMLGIEHPQVVGVIWVVLTLLLVPVVLHNLRCKREWWAILFPSFLGVFLIIEVTLDYIISYDFRSTRLIGPYLLIYYLSILGMIGYSFTTRKKTGGITLATYFLSQIVALYSYFTVGHG